MLNDPNVRTTVIPLILRLTLAAIFIYHGLVKVASPQNELGLDWAVNMVKNQAKPPAPVVAEFDRELRDLEEQGEELRKEGDRLGDGDEKEANAKKQATNAQTQADIRSARERLNFAYSKRMPLPDALSYSGTQLAVAWGELLGGLALLLGVLTRLASVGLIVIMVGAVWTVTWVQGFSAAAGAGYEYNLAVVAMCAVLILKGPGPWSIDGWLAARRTAAKERRQVAAAV